MRTLYLWDLAGTLFLEKWNKTLSGFNSFEDFVAARGILFSDARRFEECYYEPYIQGYFWLQLAPGFKEMLTWAKHNETFNTGFQKQMDWRARYLNPRVGFDIRKFFQKLNSTFDWGETNVKTPAMLQQYLEIKIKENYSTVVYSDDHLENVKFFISAAKKINRQCRDFKWRAYHVVNKNGGWRAAEGYFQAGSLLDILEKEKSIA